MKKAYQINPWLEVEFTSCTAIDETGERKSAIFVHRQGPIIDLPMFDQLRNSVVFNAEFPQSAEEADDLLDSENDNPTVLSTVIFDCLPDTNRRKDIEI